MIQVTLKGGVVREYESGTTVGQVAASLGAGLAKAACAGRVDGEVRDLRFPLEADCALEILTFEDHSVARGIDRIADVTGQIDPLVPVSYTHLKVRVNSSYFHLFGAAEFDVPQIPLHVGIAHLTEQKRIMKRMVTNKKNSSLKIMRNGQVTIFLCVLSKCS